MTTSCHHSRISTFFLTSRGGRTEKWWHAKYDYERLNDTKELELDYMEHVYMHMKGHGRSYGDSANITVKAKLHMVSVVMI